MNKSSTGSGFTVKASIKDEESESDIDDDYDLCEETSLHSSVCLVDEYNIFKAVLASMVLCPLSSILIKLANPGIQRSNPAWYGQLTSYRGAGEGLVRGAGEGLVRAGHPGQPECGCQGEKAGT